MKKRSKFWLRRRNVRNEPDELNKKEGLKMTEVGIELM